MFRRFLLIFDLNDKRVDGTALYVGYKKEWGRVTKEAKKKLGIIMISGITVLYCHSLISDPNRIVLPTKVS